MRNSKDSICEPGTRCDENKIDEIALASERIPSSNTIKQTTVKHCNVK